MALSDLQIQTLARDAAATAGRRQLEQRVGGRALAERGTALSGETVTAASVCSSTPYFSVVGISQYSPGGLTWPPASSSHVPSAVVAGVNV